MRYLKEDVARWRELRAQYELRLSRTKSLNRIASWTLATFGISFTALFAVSFLGVESPLSALLVAVDLLLLIVCGPTHIVAVLLRDAVAHGRQPWRFGLLTLLVGVTIIAVLLGLLAYESRK